MTTHRIRIAINSEGILCQTCDQPVRWDRSPSLMTQYANATDYGHWEHAPVDPVALAESMARHPSGRDL